MPGIVANNPFAFSPSMEVGVGSTIPPFNPWYLLIYFFYHPLIF